MDTTQVIVKTALVFLYGLGAAYFGSMGDERYKQGRAKVGRMYWITAIMWGLCMGMNIPEVAHELEGN